MRGTLRRAAGCLGKQGSGEKCISLAFINAGKKAEGVMEHGLLAFFFIAWTQNQNLFSCLESKADSISLMSWHPTSKTHNLG